MSLPHLIEWIQARGESGILTDLLNATVVRPLGTCGCHPSQPIIRPGTRQSQSVKSSKTLIACGRCPKCRNRTTVDYHGTPMDQTRNKLGLVTYSSVAAYWLAGSSQDRISSELKIYKGTLTALFRRFRESIIYHELNKPKLAEADCILDITWGPHRRKAHSGAPSQPRKLEQKPYQVAIAFIMNGPSRQFIPGTLSVQAITSKKATYNAKIAQTMMEASCRISCDQGGEWARLPRTYADVKTVNHSIEWVTPDGVTTNLGEASNGLLKNLGSTLKIWKGGCKDSVIFY